MSRFQRSNRHLFSQRTTNKTTTTTTTARATKKKICNLIRGYFISLSLMIYHCQTDAGEISVRCDDDAVCVFVFVGFRLCLCFFCVVATSITMCYLLHSTAKPSDDRNSFSGPRSASPSTPDPVPLPGSLGSKPNKATNRENHNEFLCFVAAGRELRWSVGLLQGRVVVLLLAALAGLVVLVGVKVPAAKWHRWLIVSIRSLFFWSSTTHQSVMA